LKVPHSKGDGIATMSTGKAAKKGGSIALKYFLIPLIGGIAIALAILALSNSLQVEIQPANFRNVNISGGPSAGYYEIFIALEDAEGRSGPSNGYVHVKITDSRQALLYRSDSLIRSHSFATYANYTGGIPTIGYRWTFPATNVTAGFPFPDGLGKIEVMFLALSGVQVIHTAFIPIPSAIE
jgi:hypothetical protein